MQTLEERINSIEIRNYKVEADKAWETSVLRKALVVVATYVVVGLFMTMIEVKRPWVNAGVPVLGFMLSTLTISWCKSWWVRRYFKQ